MTDDESERCPRSGSHGRPLASAPVTVTRTLRPAVSRPVYLEPMTRFLLLSDSCGFVHVGAPSLTTYSFCWASPELVFSGQSPAGLPQPGGPGPFIYIAQEQGRPVVPPGTKLPSRRCGGAMSSYVTRNVLSHQDRAQLNAERDGWTCLCFTDCCVLESCASTFLLTYFYPEDGSSTFLRKSW
jgi:hypothetical protein